MILTAEPLTRSKVDILFTWLRHIPYELGLLFPYANGEIAVEIFNKEINDPQFLPHDEPLHKRAEFAIPLIGEDDTEIIKNKPAYKKAHTIAQILILRHYRNMHNIDCQGYDEQLEKELNGYELTEEEKQLVASPAGFWNG